MKLILLHVLRLISFILLPIGAFLLSNNILLMVTNWITPPAPVPSLLFTIITITFLFVLPIYIISKTLPIKSTGSNRRLVISLIVCGALIPLFIIFMIA
jgi:hypothetical protein